MRRIRKYIEPHNKGKAAPYSEPPDHLLPFVAQLRRARYDKGISMTVLAEQMGYSPRTIGEWELGHKIPSLLAAQDWAEAFGYELVLLRKSSGRDILTLPRRRVKVHESTIGDDNDSSRYGKVG